jgi:hypothetical protein
VTVTNCARNGAVWGSQHPDNATNVDRIKTIALADASNLSPAPEVSVEEGSDSEGNPTIRVTVDWTFETITRIPPIPNTVAISRTVEMRVAPEQPDQ